MDHSTGAKGLVGLPSEKEVGEGDFFCGEGDQRK